MTIYISGKITGLDLKVAFDNFEQAENELLARGFEPVNPMKKVSEQEGKTWKEYMLEDIALLWDCDGIYLLKNWKQSKGAKLEWVIARELGLRCFFEYEELEAFKAETKNASI